ncbi:MAG TPA: 1-(5-phosphoribosyl)-5-[(5-phosphoribosylamino)methylideneamino] imidazole-4-carboxamide isomerase [Candidatus Acidoferrales bacterium]|nr:1-(5-phosphoribosyl)-5-[(5-phosphoribosylamino)methylideneamino] imidazole-4-carboxamide isomerase [Candidatus Acidoferrales bacterium]
MRVIPAIDLRGGRVVRLNQGDFERETVYDRDPLELAATYAAAGATRLHLVDLDAARGGSDNQPTLDRIVGALAIEVQVAGGVRTLEDVERWLDAGAEQVVMGTTAVLNPSLLETLASAHPGRILAALDVSAGSPVAHGWRTKAEATLAVILAAWEAAPIGGVILTSVDRDGTMTGPDLDLVARVRRLSRHPIAYSGGLSDLSQLPWLGAAGASSVILGKSLLDGRISLEEALGAS